MTNHNESEQASNKGPPPMLEPPKFLDQLLVELKQESAPGSVRESAAGTPGGRSFPPVARSVKTRRMDKNTLLLAALVAALLINIALVFMMFTVLRDRSGESTAAPPLVTAQRENKAVLAGPAKQAESTLNLPAEETSPAPAEIEVADAGDALPSPVMPFGIAKLALCREVRGFAEYEPIPDVPLLPHHVPQILAYVEVAHPRPEPREDGRFVYYMTVATRLYPAGDPFAEPLIDKAVSLVENGNSPRDDFHAVQPLHVNRRVGPGTYTLLVRVTDQISGETVRRETTFRVHAPQP